MTTRAASANHPRRQRRLLVLPPNPVACSSKSPTTLPSITLPHPRTGTPSTYLRYCDHKTHASHLLSLDLVSNPQSAFIDNAVHQSGSFLLATPFDTTFLLLHLLLARTHVPATPSSSSFSSSSSAAILVDDLLHSPAFPDLADLLSPPGSHGIEHLLRANLCAAIPFAASPDTVGGPCAYRFDRRKTVRWLAAKVHSLATALSARAGAVYPPLPAPQTVGDDEHKWARYAMILVGEWIPDKDKDGLMHSVAEVLGVSKVDVTPAGVLDQLVAASVAGVGGGRAMVDEGDEAGGGSKKKAKTSESKKPVNKAASIKVPKGQRSVAAFFSKKS